MGLFDRSVAEGSRVWNPASLCSKIDVAETLASCPAPKLFVDSKGQPSLPHGALIAVNFFRFFQYVATAEVPLH
jgi:hypothetical protein